MPICTCRRPAGIERCLGIDVTTKRIVARSDGCQSEERHVLVQGRLLKAIYWYTHLCASLISRKSDLLQHPSRSAYQPIPRHLYLIDIAAYPETPLPDRHSGICQSVTHNQIQKNLSHARSNTIEKRVKHTSSTCHTLAPLFPFPNSRRLLHLFRSFFSSSGGV